MLAQNDGVAIARELLNSRVGSSSASSVCEPFTMPPCKVNKLVREFCASATAGGWVFVDYLSERVTLSADQRRQLLCDPDLERVTAYLDPTGQTATRRVIPKRGY